MNPEELISRLDEAMHALLASAEKHIANRAYEVAVTRRHRAHGMAQAIEIVKEWAG